MTKAEEWAADHARRIGRTVTKLRGERSGLWLSNETAKAGHRISRTSIHELETGKRKSVTTAELCVLAWALRVPPLQLLYPDIPDGGVEIVPGIEKPSIEAIQWFSGELIYQPRDLSTDSGRQEGLEFYQGSELVRLARERATRKGRTNTLSTLLGQLNDPATAKEFVTQIADNQSRLDDINKQLRQIDGAVVGDGG